MRNLVLLLFLFLGLLTPFSLCITGFRQFDYVFFWCFIHALYACGSVELELSPNLEQFTIISSNFFRP
jgi:hypothetical protein